MANGVCTSCGASRNVQPCGPNEELVCVECAEKHPEALMNFIAENSDKVLKGIMQLAGAEAHVIDMHGDKNELAKQVTGTIQKLVMKAYNHGVWIQDFKATPQDDGMNIEFSIALEKEEITGGGKPSEAVEKAAMPSVKDKLFSDAVKGGNIKHILALISGLDMLEDALFHLSPGVIDLSHLEIEVLNAKAILGTDYEQL